MPDVDLAQVAPIAEASFALPQEIVMSAKDMVDASLVGFDRGELITIPALRDEAQWQAYEDARQAMFGGLSASTPAPRYAQA